MAPTKEQIEAELKTIANPYAGGKNIVDSGLVGNIILDGGQVGIVLEFTTKPDAEAENLRAEIEDKMGNIAGVTSANVVMTAARKAPAAPTMNQPKAPGAAPEPPRPTKLDGVKHVIAVASGKGGVGKSTTSVNIAAALSAAGYKVGIMDADIFGPSLPTLLGTDERPSINNGVIEPLEAHGMKAMSIGMLIDVDQPVVWRGPRVMGATQQLLKDVAWAPLDVLVVDMPPGTGDVQLTMVQQVVLSGAVIVSTPQDLALIDARKGLAMFEQVGTPVLGVIENMSQFTCPSCGTTSHIFGHEGAQAVAKEKNIPFLGALPLDMDIRRWSDGGTPIVVDLPDSPQALAYKVIAEKIAEKLDL